MLRLLAQSTLILAIASLAGAKGAHSQAPLAMPKPIVRAVGFEQYWVGNVAWVRHELSVDNYHTYDQKLFDLAPAYTLPCAVEAGARVLVTVLDNGNGRTLHSYCPAARENLRSIRFALPKAQSQRYVDQVRVEITDRVTRRSALSDAVQIHMSRP